MDAKAVEAYKARKVEPTVTWTQPPWLPQPSRVTSNPNRDLAAAINRFCDLVEGVRS